MSEIPRAEKHKLKPIFSEILRGFSSLYSTFFKSRVYVKHLNALDVAVLDIKGEEFFERARQNDIPTIKEREKYLVEEGFWGDKQDNKIKELNRFIENLNITKDAIINKREISEINNQLAEGTKQLLELKNEKQNLIGITAENFSSKKINEYYVFKSIFKDEKLQQPIFTEDSFDELEDPELNLIVNEYNNQNKYFNTVNFQRIAVSPFFLSLFYLSPENAYNFYGSSITSLTFYQIELFHAGIKFKNIFSELKIQPDEDLLDNPDKLIERHKFTQNTNKLIDTAGNEEGYTAIIGVSQQDLNDTGVTDERNSGFNMAQQASKQGKKRISMRDSF